MSTRLSSGVTKVGVVVHESPPRVLGVEGVVARARQRERRLKMESTVDALTGLQNQNQWVAARPRVDQDPGQWVLRLDVDRFKEINDTQGHAVGDEWLTMIGEVINIACLGVGISQRMRFRSGGDEFTVVGTLVDVTLVANYALRRVNDHLRNDEPGGVSFGIGRTDQEADQAMYRNKQTRATRIRVDVRQDDGEPFTSGQVDRDSMIQRSSVKCIDPTCDVVLPGHSHYARRQR